MERRRAVLVGGVTAAVAAVLLAGCTSSSGDDSGKTNPSDAPGAANSAPAPGGVLVEQTIDTPSTQDTKPHGGTVTVIVRSVLASEGRTAVSWALRWDNPDAADSASVPLSDLVEVEPPTLVDGTALKYYYPLCAYDYRNVVGAQNCGYHAHYYPRTIRSAQPDLVNHRAMEGWAVFPEVGKDTATVDLALYGGLPALSELPVTRP